MRVPFLLASTVLIAATPSARLSDSKLEAVHAQRLEWMKQRAAAPLLGIYQDYRAVFTHSEASRAEFVKAARDAGAQIVFAPREAGTTGGVLFLPLPTAESPFAEIYRGAAIDAEDWRKLRGRFQQYPDEVLGAGTDAGAELLAAWDRDNLERTVTGFAFSDPPAAAVPLAAAFRNTSTHILARELSETDVRASLEYGHAYVAHDWLCDPAGFAFIAENSQGVYDMGDTVPTGLLGGQTMLRAALPVRARIKLLRDGQLVTEATDSRLSYQVKDPGAYRLEVWLTAGGEDRPWIYSNPIYVRGGVDIRLPELGTPDSVDGQFNITYTEGEEADAAKHKLDLYLPRGKTGFPVMLFVHGGSWRSGDRVLYRALGNRYARAGIGVAIPSYRLMPQNADPAQIEDVAAAFAWVYQNIAGYGGDVKRIYVAGHSAGGHLVSLLALDHQYLDKYSIPASAIRGVISVSGVYDVRNLQSYSSNDRGKASPLLYVKSGAPPFLIAYCQWDYLGLPKQARDFGAALKKSFDVAQMVYIPGETHISEILATARDDGPLPQAFLSFIQ